MAEPCDHPGCKSHLTHPCEVCGQRWSNVPMSAYGLAKAYWGHCHSVEEIEKGIQAIMDQEFNAGIYALWGEVARYTAENHGIYLDRHIAESYERQAEK